MLAALPVILGIQMILSFLAHDVAVTPSRAIHRDIDRVTVMKPDGTQPQSKPDHAA
jgi:hypothetical protein